MGQRFEIVRDQVEVPWDDAPFRRYVPGTVRYLVDGVEVSPDEFFDAAPHLGISATIRIGR